MSYSYYISVQLGLDALTAGLYIYLSCEASKHISNRHHRRSYLMSTEHALAFPGGNKSHHSEHNQPCHVARPNRQTR